MHRRGLALVAFCWTLLAACDDSAPASDTPSTGGASSGGGSGSGGSAASSGSSGSAGTSGAGGASGSSGGSGATGAGTGGTSGASGSSSGGSGATSAGTGGTSGGTGGASGAAGSAGGTTTYDRIVLDDGPVAYFAMSGTTSEQDLSGHGHVGTYQGGAPAPATLPNGDRAAAFDGERQFLSVPSHAALSIPTTGELTWEAWIRPDVVDFPNDSGGYVDWMGKCADYAPSCEWEARMYNAGAADRCNRLSAYAFNPSAGLGSGAYWQADPCGTIEAGAWYHVVGAYTLERQPASCQNSAEFPGAIDIWVNGVKWNQSTHGQTGCMSQYDVAPVAGDSPLNVGTMAGDAWFQGAVGKLAIYDKPLSDARIAAHYEAMTGRAPTGSCGSNCSF